MYNIFLPFLLSHSSCARVCVPSLSLLFPPFLLFLVLLLTPSFLRKDSSFPAKCGLDPFRFCPSQRNVFLVCITAILPDRQNFSKQRLSSVISTLSSHANDMTEVQNPPIKNAEFRHHAQSCSILFSTYHLWRHRESCCRWLTVCAVGLAWSTKQFERGFTVWLRAPLFSLWALPITMMKSTDC